MISHYAWPGGLAFVVEAPRRRVAAVLDRAGWRHGDPRKVWRDGPPAGADETTLSLPSWLVEQVPRLECSLAGLHTDVVRMNRLLARLQANKASGLVLVIGHSPAAIVVSDGVPTVVVPAGPDGEHPDMAMARAVGWVVVYTGAVAVSAEAASQDQGPLEQPAAPPLAEPIAQVAPGPVAEPVRTVDEPAPEVVPHAAAEAPVVAPVVAEPQVTPAGPGLATPVASLAGNGARPPVDECFVASSGAARALAEGLTADLNPELRDAGRKVVDLLDGSRTLAGIAESTGLPLEQVAQIVRTLVGAKLAFRYVSRARPTTGARAPR